MPEVLFEICGRGYMTPSRIHSSVAKKLASSWPGCLCMGVACTPQSHCSTSTTSAWVLSPWHTFTDLGQTFLRHGDWEMGPDRPQFFNHLGACSWVEQKRCSLLLVWQKLNSITDLLLKSSGGQSHSLQAKCLKKMLDEFKVLFTPKKLIKRSGV